ncbi:MAG: DUF2779 domain-containing protein [Deferrisomatales bacterium]
MRTPTISKTSYVTGRQCPRWLWHRIRRPWAIPAADEATQRRFDLGHQVGDTAKRLFPDGVEIPWGQGMGPAVEATRAALAERRPIFEATFLHASPRGPTLVRADVLRPAAGGAWDLLEVKGSTGVKPVYLEDVAFQRYVAAGAGLEIDRCFLVHLDSSYRRRGQVDPAALFHLEDVTAATDEKLSEVEARLEALFRTLEHPEPPEVPIGPHCSSPYDCPLGGDCWRGVPARSVFGLTGVRSVKAWGWFERGISARAELPAGERLTDKQCLQLATERTGEPHADAPALAAFLGRLRYPVHYFDLETFRPPIPLFDGVGPYGAVPFQFSLHVQDAPGGPLRHHGYLADLQGGQADPRPLFLEQARAALGSQGSIVAYSAGYEKRILRETAAEDPETRQWLETRVFPRFVDLLAPFRSFHYYHPAQEGSASLKSVLPALGGRGYGELEIGDGETAGAEFLRISLDDVEAAERARVRAALETYGGLDTEGMAVLVDALRRLAGG